MYKLSYHKLTTTLTIPHRLIKLHQSARTHTDTYTYQLARTDADTYIYQLARTDADTYQPVDALRLYLINSPVVRADVLKFQEEGELNKELKRRRVLARIERRVKKNLLDKNRIERVAELSYRREGEERKGQEMIVLTPSTLKFTCTLNIPYHLKV